MAATGFSTFRPISEVEKTLVLSGDFDSSSPEIDRAFSLGGLLVERSRYKRACETISSLRNSPIQKISLKALEFLARTFFLAGDYSKSREACIEYYDRVQGEIDLDAYSVEQNEYAVGIGHAFGTASVGECMAIAVYQESTGMVGVAHVDVQTDEESIAKFLSEFPVGRLSITIIGGSPEKDLIETSTENKEKCLRAIKAREDVVIEDRTISVEHPTAFVIRAEGSIEEDRVPGNGCEMRHARNALATFTAEVRPLRKAYEVSGAEVKALPVEISEGVLREVTPYFGMDEKALMARLSPTGVEKGAFVIQEAFALKELISLAS